MHKYPRTLEGVSNFWRMWGVSAEPMKAMRHLVDALDESKLDYAFCGGVATNFYGAPVFREWISLVLSEPDCKAFAARWLERGWISAEFPYDFFDTRHDVPVRVVFPGESSCFNKAQCPVVYQAPTEVTVIDGIHFVDLHRLIELKIAAGLSHDIRIGEFLDVMDLIRANHLHRELALELHEHVRAKYDELWTFCLPERDR